MHRLVASALIVSLLFSSGCILKLQGVKGNGIIRTDVRPMTAFEEVECSGVADLVIDIGPASPVAVTCDDNLLPLVETKIAGKRLIISQTQSIAPTQKLVIKFTVPSLTAIDVSGAGSVTTTGLAGGPLKVELSGASDVRLDGAVDDLKIECSGAGEVTAKNLAGGKTTLELSGSTEITLAGKVRTLSIDGSGASDVNAKDLDAERVAIKLSGSGSADVNASDTLDIHVSGAADIVYGGSPKITQSISGAGSVKRRR